MDIYKSEMVVNGVWFNEAASTTSTVKLPKKSDNNVPEVLNISDDDVTSFNGQSSSPKNSSRFNFTFLLNLKNKKNAECIH